MKLRINFTQTNEGKCTSKININHMIMPIINSRRFSGNNKKTRSMISDRFVPLPSSVTLQLQLYKVIDSSIISVKLCNNHSFALLSCLLFSIGDEFEQLATY